MKQKWFINYPWTKYILLYTYITYKICKNFTYSYPYILPCCLLVYSLFFLQFSLNYIAMETKYNYVFEYITIGFFSIESRFHLLQKSELNCPCYWFLLLTLQKKTLKSNIQQISNWCPVIPMVCLDKVFAV